MRILRLMSPLFLLATMALAGPPKVGDPARPFSLTTSEGSISSLKDYAGKSNVVLVFYRGYW